MADGSILKAALTGSIAMGKSTVAAMLRDAGIAVFDADAVVHQLYAKNGKAVEAVGRLFPSVVKDGAIDRAALSTQVLNDTQAMKKLEAVSRCLTYPCCLRPEGRRSLTLYWWYQPLMKSSVHVPWPDRG